MLLIIIIVMEFNSKQIWSSCQETITKVTETTAFENKRSKRLILTKKILQIQSDHFSDEKAISDLRSDVNSGGGSEGGRRDIQNTCRQHQHENS